MWNTLRVCALSLLIPSGLAAQPQCKPCVGIAVDDAFAAAAALSAATSLPEEATFFVKWRVDLTDTPSADIASVRATGATPWLSVTLRTPPPLLENGDRLAGELAALARLAAAGGADVYYQLDWQPEDVTGATVEEYAFLVKRAAVAVTGAEPTAQLASKVLAPESAGLEALYDGEVAAYLDAITLPPLSAGELERLAAVIAERDPGSLVVIDAVEPAAEPLEAVAEAARAAAAGATISLFRIASYEPARLDPLLLLAREFYGDLSLDPYLEPTGAREAWSFVRGSDLGLRVIVARPPETSEELLLRFSDRQLSSPSLIDPSTGELEAIFGARRATDGFVVPLSEPAAVSVIALERLRAGELEGMEGIEESVRVADTRQIPVEEILRRLQAFEDAQNRSLKTYQATNTTHLRFSFGNANQNIETTFEGDFFFRQGEGFDWAWQRFFVNGVRWRREKIPQVPLIQAEKASTLPIEITFTKEYRYRLRGTDVVDGRDCWVVDFQPNVRVEPGRSLYQGTVWIDREIYARVRTRAVQLGLEGDVISNEETLYYSPVDGAGEPGDWNPRSYFLPLRVVGQQLWSILNATVVVEREVLLSQLQINPESFDDRLAAIRSSKVTMLRDTDAGLRYLVVDEESGERVVQERLDPSRLFLVGGVFFDESQDFPIPLAGVNWLSFDWRETGTQVNFFFAGALLTADIASPNVFGSKFDLGLDVFALAFAGTDNLFREGREVDAEDVEVMRPNFDLSVGRPFGSFFKLDFQYSLGYSSFSRADDTDPDFVLPQDHLNHTFSLTGRYNRSGYQLRLRGSRTIRDDWKRWGLPGETEFRQEQEQYDRWGATLGKTWHLPNFRKIGAQIQYLDGDNLDRFSKYEFGFFSDVRVHGYQSDKVRASKAWAANLSYGFDLGELLRLDFLADAAWATDQEAGLDNELLAGLGINGTLVGPWATVINLDLGFAVEGPDDGFSAFVAFLKLFPGR